MKTDTFRWDSGDGEIAVEITVSQASLQRGLDRDKTVGKMVKVMRDKENRYAQWLDEMTGDEKIVIDTEAVEQAGIGTDFSTWMAYTNWYPACLHGTITIKNDKDAKVQISKNLSVEQFLELPEHLALRWVNKALALNPHWMPGYKDEDEQGEANAPANENGSTDKS